MTSLSNICDHKHRINAEPPFEPLIPIPAGTDVFLFSSADVRLLTGALCVCRHIEKVEAFRKHTECVEHYDSCVTACNDRKCTLGCRLAPKLEFWFPGGPALSPLPPVYRDESRPGHYLPPEATIEQYARNNCSLRNAVKPPSEQAALLYESQTRGAPFEPFPERELENAVASINDAGVDRAALLKHYQHLRYCRLRAAEGIKKAKATRERKQQQRVAAAGTTAKPQQSLVFPVAPLGGGALAAAADACSRAALERCGSAVGGTAAAAPARTPAAAPAAAAAAAVAATAAAGAAPVSSLALGCVVGSQLLACPVPLDPSPRRLGFGDLTSISCGGVSVRCLPASSDGAIPAAAYDPFAPFGGLGAREGGGGGGPGGPPLGSIVCAPNAAAPPQPNQPPVYPTPPPPPQSDASAASAPPDAAGSPPAPPSTEQPAQAEDLSMLVEPPVAPSEKPAITFHNVSIYKHRLTDKVWHTRLSHLSQCRGICP